MSKYDPYREPHSYIAELETERDDLRDELARLTTIKADYESEIARLNSEVLNATAELERLRTLTETRDLMLRQLRAQFDDMVRQRDRAQAELEQARFHNVSITVEKALRDEIDRLQTDRNRWRDMWGQADAENSRLKAELGQHWNAITSRLQIENAELKRELEAERKTDAISTR